MDEPVGKRELEALGNAEERHRTQMQKAWAQADITSAYEPARPVSDAKKATHSKPKPGRVAKD